MAHMNAEIMLSLCHCSPRLCDYEVTFIIRFSLAWSLMPAIGYTIQNPLAPALARCSFGASILKISCKAPIIVSAWYGEACRHVIVTICIQRQAPSSITIQRLNGLRPLFHPFLSLVRDHCHSNNYTTFSWPRRNGGCATVNLFEWTVASKRCLIV